MFDFDFLVEIWTKVQICKLHEKTLTYDIK